MEKNYLRAIRPKDYKRVVEIYNSNRGALLHHLGVEFVDEAFISKEVLTMEEVGFSSCVMIDREKQMFPFELMS